MPNKYFLTLSDDRPSYAGEDGKCFRFNPVRENENYTMHSYLKESCVSVRAVPRSKSAVDMGSSRGQLPVPTRTSSLKPQR